MEKTPPISPWMTRREAADWLRVSPTEIDRMGRDGRLTRHKVEGSHGIRYLKRQVVGLVKPVPDEVIGTGQPEHLKVGA